MNYCFCFPLHVIQYFSSEPLPQISVLTSSWHTQWNDSLSEINFHFKKEKQASKTNKNQAALAYPLTLAFEDSGHKYWYWQQQINKNGVRLLKEEE